MPRVSKWPAGREPLAQHLKLRRQATRNFSRERRLSGAVGRRNLSAQFGDRRIRAVRFGKRGDKNPPEGFKRQARLCKTGRSVHQSVEGAAEPLERKGCLQHRRQNGGFASNFGQRPLQGSMKICEGKASATAGRL